MPLLPKTMEALREQSRETAVEYPVALRSQNVTRTRQLAEDAKKKAVEATEAIDAIEVVVDDEVPPGTPTGVEVATASRALVITWDLPPHDDWVESSRVEIKRMDTGEFAVHDTQDVSYVALGLDVTPYEVRVKHVDRWNLESQWSASVAATPDRSVADEISENIEINAGRIFGELGVENIPAITDAGKLVAGVKAALTQAGETEDRYISANLLAAWDVVAGRAIIADATVDRALISDLAVSAAKIDDLAVTSAKIAALAVTSAKVSSLSADKIIAGVLKATISISSGGSISTGGALMDEMGVTLAQTNSYLGFPSSAPGSFLTSRLTPLAPPSPYAGIGFFSSADQLFRGIQINADGASGSNPVSGMIRLCATNGSQDNTNQSTAVIEMAAGKGEPSRIGMKENLNVNTSISTSLGDIVSGRDMQAKGRIFPSAEIQGAVGGNGGTITLNHSRGTPADLYQTEYLDPSGNWRQFVDQIAGFNVISGANVIRVTNNNQATLTVKISYYG